jgi:PleD family two-component response regulator
MPSARAATRSPLVLIADGHEWFSRALESVLVPGGYSVVKAYTAPSLLEQLEVAAPDAVILAVDLPGGNGLNLCRMLRADSLVTPSTPIILTQPGPTTRRETLAALRAGAAELWGQRLDAEELLLRLAAQVRAKGDADRAWAEGLVDHATQLYNGRGLARRARELGAEARRRSAPLACVAFAVDGGDEGDGGDADTSSPERIARVLRETGRTSDALGRIGPKEFVVIAPETGADAALRLAQRLAGALTGRSPRRIGGVARAEFLAGYDAVADAAMPKFDPATLLAHASAALAAAAQDPAAGRIRRFENGLRPT